jgi:hypothetical protein
MRHQVYVVWLGEGLCLTSTEASSVKLVSEMDKLKAQSKDSTEEMKQKFVDRLFRQNCISHLSTPWPAFLDKIMIKFRLLPLDTKDEGLEKVKVRKRFAETKEEGDKWGREIGSMTRAGGKVRAASTDGGLGVEVVNKQSH